MEENKQNKKNENIQSQKTMIKKKTIKPDLQKTTAQKTKINFDVINKELKTKLIGVEEKLLRALAENDNLRKRHDKEIEDNSKYAIKDFSYSLLSVADNLVRAIESIPKNKLENNDILKNLYIGIEATQKDLLNVLDKHGIKKFDSMDKKFDPELHQAVSKKHSEKAEGIIIEEMQGGYKIGERLLRAAMVVVSTGPEKNSEIKFFFFSVKTLIDILILAMEDNSVFFSNRLFSL